MFIRRILTAILLAGSNGQLGVVLEGVYIELVLARTVAGKDLVHFRVQQHLVGILIARLQNTQKKKNKNKYTNCSYSIVFMRLVTLCMSQVIANTFQLRIYRGKTKSDESCDSQHYCPSSRVFRLSPFVMLTICGKHLEGREE